jgi:hypothetical protein
MAYQNADSPELQLGAKWENLGPRLIVAVTPNRRDGSERAQLREQLRRAYVSGMDDVSHPFEKLLHLGVEMAVRVREDADADEAGAATT